MLSSRITAIVNLKINDYTFSGSKIESVNVNLGAGGSSKSDDKSVFKVLR